MLNREINLVFGEGGYFSTQWTDLGFANANRSEYIKLAIDINDKPVIVLHDYYSSFDVKRWDSGTSWIDLGYPRSPASASSIIVDASNNIWTFVDDFVDKWDGVQWSAMGRFPGAMSNSIALTPVGNIPFVVTDSPNGKAHVYQFVH